jgi:hypothetical protein
MWKIEGVKVMPRDNKKRTVIKKYSGALRKEEVIRYLIKSLIEKKQDQINDE